MVPEEIHGPNHYFEAGGQSFGLSTDNARQVSSL